MSKPGPIPDRAYKFTHTLYEIREDGQQPELSIAGAVSAKEDELFIHAHGRVYYMANGNVHVRWRQEEILNMQKKLPSDQLELKL